MDKRATLKLLRDTQPGMGDATIGQGRLRDLGWVERSRVHLFASDPAALQVGTIAQTLLRVVRQRPDVDTIVLPCAREGLASEVALAVREIGCTTRVLVAREEDTYEADIVLCQEGVEEITATRAEIDAAYEVLTKAGLGPASYEGALTLAAYWADASTGARDVVLILPGAQAKGSVLAA